MKVNENGEVLEYKEHTISHVSSTTHYNKQNGIAIPDEVTTTIKTKQLNGPSQVYTRVETISVHSNGNTEPAVEKTEFQSVASTETHEFLNGPEQVLPATSLSTSLPNGRIKLRIEESGSAARPPISVPGLLHQRAVDYPNFPALVSKEEDGQWKTLTFKEYEAAVRTCAKAFLKLGLKRYHSVGILGFNSPEWFISNMAAIYAGGFAAGIYTTNSPEACHYCALHCRANIMVVEDKKQLDKILEIKDRLPELKAIVQYNGKPDAEGVLSWEELMKIGSEEPDTKLDNVMKTIGVNECCTIVFTSGTVGNPKAAMLSHDNFTWNAIAVMEYIGVETAKEVIVSYLPLSHVAAQILDIYLSVAVVGTVYFADKDALKGSLVKTLQEVRPTRFLAVPRVWEKMQEKMLQISSQSGALKRAIASWAKGHGFQHHMDRMNGIESNSFSYLLARTLIFSRVKQALGLDRCITFISGAAPISIDVKKYFMSIDIPVMDGFGMSETAGVHTVSYEKAFRLEAIGKMRPGIYSKIINPDEENQGEICFQGRHIFMGYLDDPEKTAEALDEEGWLHSGDLGKIDDDDFVYITGRLKELIITAGGENIAPIIIEEEVKTQLPCISNAMLIGDKRKFLSMLLTFKTEINMETGDPLDELTPEAKKWCKNVGFEANTIKDILEGQNKKVMEAIQEGIDRANAKSISNAQRIQKFQILPHDFSIPTGEIGPTMKLKRNVTTKMYEDIIERFYKET